MLFCRRFEPGDQIEFAGLSGDWNPIHVDPISARRTIYGQIVHGIHTLAWVLDGYFAGPDVPVPGKIKVAFLKPINLGEEVQVVRRMENAETVLLVQRQAKATASVRIYPGAPVGLRNSTVPPSAPEKAQLGTPSPEIKSFEELRGAQGAYEAWGDVSLLKLRFPNLVGAIGPLRTAALLGLSRLVGMRCPGLHSIFSGLEFAFLPSEEASVRYQVTRHSIPNAPIRIAFTGGGLEGTLDAFVRPAPAQQIRMEELRRHVRHAEFSGQTALIIGGSRGLGEAMAKIIAAGGGLPIITYLLGEQDARRVAEEIRAGGGACRTLQLDVLDAQRHLEELMASDASPTHVYYFASPTIQNNKGSTLDGKLLASFLSYYVQAFDGICRVLARGKGVRVLYPSTVYLDEGAPGFAEYVCAKAAGETLCGCLAREHSNLSFLIERLPRMHTDQTNSFLEKKGAEAHVVLLGVARKMNHQEAAQWA